MAPLFLFLAVFFLAPIAAMLFRSLDNSELPSAMPRTAEVLRAWDGAGLPPEPVFATFASELAAGQKARNLAGVAKRLTYEIPNMRSALFATARALPDAARRHVAEDPDRHQRHLGRSGDLGGHAPRRGTHYAALPAGRRRPRNGCRRAISSR